MTPSHHVVIVQTTIPDYRTRFFEGLTAELGTRLLLISGDQDFALDLKHVGGVPHVRARNHFLARRRLLWQSGILGNVLRARVAVLVLNPRILSNWVALVIRRVMRKRTILWGHAWPRIGKTGRTDRLRGVMRGLADTLIVYTETQAEELCASSPRTDVVAAPNALYSTQELVFQPSDDSPRDFVYVGRLTPAKKPDLLLEAFRRAKPALPEDVRLVFVGEGPLRRRLEVNARRAGLEEGVLFLGHLSEVDDLRQVYAGALASVSPGYVGLSLIQSLGFGVPMIAARDEPHSPEIEAAAEKENVEFFASDSPEALSSILESVARSRDYWLSRREGIAAHTRARYNIEQMVGSFVGALRLDAEPLGTARE